MKKFKTEEFKTSLSPEQKKFSHESNLDSVQEEEEPATEIKPSRIEKVKKIVTFKE